MCGNDSASSSSPAVALHTSVNVNHGLRCPERSFLSPGNPGFITGPIVSTSVAATPSVDGSCGATPLGMPSAADSPKGFLIRLMLFPLFVRLRSRRLHGCLVMPQSVKGSTCPLAV